MSPRWIQSLLLAVCAWVALAAVANATPTGLDYVFFTGLGTGSTLLDRIANASFQGKSGEGLQTLKQEFDTDFASQHVMGRGFSWDKQADAGAFVGTLNRTDALVIVGHSFGGDSALQFAKEFIPSRNIDLLATIDAACVSCPGGTIKPTNVLHEVEFYHTPNSGDGSLVPFLERLNNPDQSINVTTLFNQDNNHGCLVDVGGTVTHTNISNSACVHQIIRGESLSLFQNNGLRDVTTFLSSPEPVPEPSSYILFGSGVLALASRKLFSVGK